MGWYFRKSIGSGPFRINFSKSGISYSLGVKGARVNFSNRGTYVNFGANGIYYRKKISSTNNNYPNSNYLPKHYEPITELTHSITSGNVDEISDVDSQDFIDELTEKSNKTPYYNLFGVIPLILTTILLIYFIFYNNTIIPNDEIKKVVTTIDNANLNIRTKPNKESKVLGVINPNEKFDFLGDTLSYWNIIDFNGTNGYVSMKFSKVEEITKQNDSTTEPFFNSNKGLSILIVIFNFVLFYFWLSYLKRKDIERLLVEINYEIDDDTKKIYETFLSHFSEIHTSQRVWQYLHTQATYDYKYTSGAGTNVNRIPVNSISKNKLPSKIFKTNIEVPFMSLKNTELYFFPERLIIKRNNKFGAIMYKNISAGLSTVRFIQDGSVPNDALIVDRTWRYLNKNGSPDRRFSNNYQIPICNYSEYKFASSSGLNEHISTSKLGAFDNFIKSIKIIGLYQSKYDDTHQQNTKYERQSKPLITITKTTDYFTDEFLETYLDPLFEKSARLVVETQSGSTSMLQRKFAIGFNRAGRIMDLLEKYEIVKQDEYEPTRRVMVRDENELNKIFETIK